MEGPQQMMENTESLVPGTGIDSITFLSSLASSGTGLVSSSLADSTFAYTLSSLPLSLAGTMAKEQRDLGINGPDLSLAQNAIETLARLTDVEPLKSDLSKQLLEDKGLSPLNILVPAYTDAGQGSPAGGSQTGLPVLHYRPAGSGGDTMLSAINYTDNEMLNDSAFDINNTTSAGLNQLDDNFLGLGNPASNLRLQEAQGGNAFDLFDGDALSPFGDTGLAIEAGSLQGIENERSTDNAFEDLRGAGKNSANKKGSQQSGLGSPGKCTAQCPTCGKQFNNVSALAKHRLTHSDERKYLCTVCNKGFKRQDHLNGHQMTHLDKKPFQCQVENCDKGYCDARSLRRHLETYHHLPSDIIQNHVQASMAASGITPPSQRNGKSRSSDGGTGKLTTSDQGTQRLISSPSYSASSTPSPSPGSGGQNQFFHFEVQANKAGGTGGSVSVKVDPLDAGDLQLHKLQQFQEIAMQQQQTTLQASAVAADQNQSQFQVQFQLQQAPASFLAVVHQAQLQLLQQQQQQQQQQQKASEQKGTVLKQQQIKAAIEGNVKMQESSPQSRDVAGGDGGSSQQSADSWQDRAQIYNFVGTPGSGDQSPTSLSGDASPGLVQQMSPSPSPSSAMPSSPLQNAQRPNWSSAAADKNGDEGKCPVQCNVCQRRFKTIPALNGHMRLHGGYLRKDDNKRSSSKKASTSSSSSSSPSTPTDMGPPPPPPPPPQQLSLQPPSASPQPQSPTPTTGTLQPLPPVALSTTASPQVTDLHAMQTFYLTGSHTLQPVSISHLAAADVIQQQQMLQHQLELQMAQQLKEEQDIRSLEEQLKQNIHEQNIQQLSSLAEVSSLPAISQVQATPISLSQVTDALGDVSHALSPLRAASPQTQQAEHIQRLVEGFQQVEELHRQQQQQQQQQVTLQVPQLTALQIQQLQQQHIQLGLPPLQPAQLQQLLQEQHLQQQLFQQQQQQQTTDNLPRGQSLASMHLGQTHVVLHSPPIMLSGSTGSGQIVTVSNVAASSAGASSPVTSANSVSSIIMTPGLPGGVLSNGQQLHLGSSQLVSLSTSSVVTQAPNPSPSHNPHSHLSLSQSSEQQPTTLSGASLATLISTSSPSQHYMELAQQHLVTSSAETLSMGEAVDVQDSTMCQLMSDLEGGIGSELLQMPNPHVGGQGLVGDILSGGMVLGHQSMAEKLPGFQSFQSLISTQGRLTPPSGGHILLDSIKQDVMLSSAVSTQPHPSGSGEAALEHFTGNPSSGTHASSIKNTHSELKRRLSADSRLSVASTSTLTTMLSKGASYPGHYLKPANEEENGSNSGVTAAARVRMRSKSGDIHKFMRSKSVDHSVMRPRSSTEESIYRPRKRSGDETFIGRSKSHGEDYLSQSDGAGVFRNPGSLPSPFKIKRKHRPTPLFIPTCFSSFQSRLRSPRLWDGGDTKGRGHTPPPYTPPPMLSPIRSGSGLFWTIQSARPLTPQSAPVSARLSLSRRGSFVEATPDTIPKDVDESPPPETDIKPHVNVGVQYQAEVPSLIENRNLAFVTESKEDLMWDPSILNINTEEDVQSYQDFACCAAVKGNGSNVEYALHLLYLSQGDIQMAMLMLMSDPPLLPPNHGLLSYKYQETESWKSSEIEAFHQALNEFDKDFFNVARRVGSKSVKECIQFYYLWKKVCPDDYKRLRVSRRKRIQSGLYNLRSQQPNSLGAESGHEQVQDAGLTNPHDEFEYEGSDSDTEDQNHTSGMVASDAMLPDLAAEAELSSVASSPAAPSSLMHGQEMTNIMTHMASITSTSMPNTPPMVLPHTTSSVMVSMAPVLPPLIPSTPPPVPAPPPPPAFVCDYQGCGATLNSKQSLMRHMRRHLKDTEESSLPRPPRPKPRPSTPSKSPIYDQHGEEIFPCKLCDRVFTKVKSRSAHMKSHKMAEAEKKLPTASIGFINPTPPSPMEDS